MERKTYSFSDIANMPETHPLSQYLRLKTIVDRLTYKPNWGFDLFQDLISGSLGLTIIANVDNAGSGPPPKLSLTTTLWVTPEVLEKMDDQAICERIFLAIVSVERHEASEWFKVADVAIFNEHDAELSKK